jgi:hypothetical protein
MANNFRVHDLIADNVYSISGIYTNITANNLIYNTGNQTISGNKIFSDQITFNSTSVTAPNQTITNSSSILTKGLADTLYASNYFSITAGLSSGIDNDAIGQKVHSFILPSGTWEFQCFASLSGTVATGGQGTRFYLYPDNTYSFYGNSIRHLGLNLVSLSTASSATIRTDNNSAFFLHNASNSSLMSIMVNGVLNINQQTEVPIYISQNIQQTGQPIYLLQGSYLKAVKIN